VAADIEHVAERTAVEHDCAIGETFELRQVMAGDDDRAVVRPELGHDVAQPHTPDGIEALRRLIEHDERPAREQRLCQADTLEQAVDRAGVKAGNKGFEAAMSAVELVNLYRDAFPK
jgi:hypothetical protein